MNDPEVMENIAAALSRIAYWLERIADKYGVEE